MGRLGDRQPFLRVAVSCGALGVLFSFVAVRMLLEGATIADEVWALGLGVLLLGVAAAAVRRGRQAARYERLRAQANARAQSRADVQAR
jgi:hypothetical protein